MLKSPRKPLSANFILWKKIAHPRVYN